MNDSDDEYSLIKTVAWMDEYSFENLFDFRHKPDAKQTLHQLGYTAQFLSDHYDVPKGKKQELLDRIKDCHAALEKKDYGEFTQQLFNYGGIFDRYILEARRIIKSQEKQEKERGPFLFYAVNRAVVLWAKDDDCNLSLPHMSGLIEIELSNIVESIRGLLEDNSEFQGHNPELQYIENFRVTKSTIKDWLEKENDVVQIPDYARPNNSPQKKFRESWNEMRRHAESHDYYVRVGSGKYFGSLIPIELNPPTYQ